MSIFETSLPEGWVWEPLGRHYRITKKPRALDYAGQERIPFAPMEAVPAGGSASIRYDSRLPEAITSGTYFERGDVLVARITPSFENGKQGKADDLPAAFGVGSTELIPLQPIGKGDPWYLFYYLLHPDVRDHLTGKMEGSTARQRVPDQALLELMVPTPPPTEQARIACVFRVLQRLRDVEARAILATRELKQAAMQQLFTQGLRGEEQKETEIGPVPASWDVVRLGTRCDVVSSSLSYTDFSAMQDISTAETVKAMGVKVSDMNREGNSVRFTHSAIEKHVPRSVAERRLVPPDTIVFPKRGAAIATNKKRLTTAWTVLDPNLIGVRAREQLTTAYLFYWLQSFDLRSITEPGPTPQLNKKHLVPLSMPVPSDYGEQAEITAVLEAIDESLDVHERKRAALEQLCRALLNDLMTGRLRVRDSGEGVAA